MENYKVYYHKNKINGKYYIGITKKENPEKRWRKGEGNKNQFFYKAIQKYGWDNFEHKILFDGLTIKEAKEKEIELIKKYNTLAPNGYNIGRGGETNYKDGAIICIETNEIFEDVYDLLNKQEYLFHGKIKYEDIKDCCEYNRKNIKIPWRNLYYHYQYYTSKPILTIKQIENTCDLKKRKKRFLKKNYNKFYNGRLIIGYLICENCGDIYKRIPHKSLKLCPKCREKLKKE